jgi:hypothetical protein
MKKKIWRLSSAPTVEDLKLAVEAEIITKDEAKEILLREEEDIPKDHLKEVKDEIKLLRDLVMKISSEPKYVPYTYPIIVKQVEHYPTPSPWVNPWITWCSSNSKTYGDSNSNSSGTLVVN